MSLSNEDDGLDKIWRRVNNKEDAITSAEDMSRAGFTYPIKGRRSI